MKKQMFGLVLASALSTSALAQPAGYLGADFSFMSSTVKWSGFFRNYSEDADPTALRVRGGAQLNENFAIEGVIGLGLQDDTIDALDADFGLDKIIGISAVGIVPLDRTFGIFGKIGFASVEYTSDNNDYSIDDTGVTFGVGAKVNFDRRGSAFTIEYSVLPDVEDSDTSIKVESEMISVGAQFAF